MADARVRLFNQFEHVELEKDQVFPVKLNGKIVGTGTIKKDGAIELDIEDEVAKRKLQGNEVGGLSVDYNSKTIQAIMNNRKRNS